ncbi:hypothetical protein MMC31_007859, partial [Peltigera leucophlebia]|nr:hypothetical protein [Peltigera leucophlebia]
MTIYKTNSIPNAVALGVYILFILMTGYVLNHSLDAINYSLDGDRYKFVHKPGNGASLTLWLARDRNLQGYFALEVNGAGLSQLFSELGVLQHFSKSKSDYLRRFKAPHPLSLVNSGWTAPIAGTLPSSF